MMRFRSSAWLWTLLLASGPVAFIACDTNPLFDVDGDRNGDDDGKGSGDDDGDGLGGTDGGGLGVIGSGGGDSSGSGGDGPVCEQTSAETELAPIFLAFAFDVSGSMGHFDRPNWWHDPDAKWTPVAEATAAFFQDADSTGISASMKLFPSLGSSDVKCAADTYEAPEVTMRGLPSDAFADVFADYEAEVDTNDDGDLRGGAWRGSTPTLAAFTGTATYLDTFRAANPDAKFVVVLVTDGLPQGCTGQDDVALVAGAAETLLSDSGVPTYVIGIQNPADPPGGWDTPALPAGWANWGTCPAGSTGGGAEPCTSLDTLGALDAIAAAGGSETAFLIDTDDPEATKTAFKNAINAIRTQAVSCDLEIPPHPDGGTFDKDKINVSRTFEGETTALTYDPDCTEENAWRYDDEDDPSYIELCPATCDDVRGAPGTDLNVDFLCEVRPGVIR